MIYWLKIKEANVRLFYREKKDGNCDVYSNGLLIATVSYSETLKTWWIRFKNISIEVGERETQVEAHGLIQQEFIRFIERCYQGAESNEGVAE